MSRYTTVIFDLDGTLLDTLQDLTDSVNYALDKHGFVTHRLEDVRRFVGNGVRKLMELAVPGGEDNKAFEQTFQDFKEHYSQNCHNHTKLYDNVLELLEELKKAKQARTGKVIALVSVFLLAVGIFLYWWLPKAKWVGPDGGDKETRAKERAQEVVELMDAGDYDVLKENAIALMEDYLTPEYMGGVKDQLSTDWGERVSVGTGYVVEVSQQGQTYQIVELQVVYENVSVIYSITLDEELRLAGLYMR